MRKDLEIGWGDTATAREPTVMEVTEAGGASRLSKVAALSVVLAVEGMGRRL
jgi:hypothetical protein